PLAGRLADRSGPEIVTRLGAGLAALSFAAMWLAPLLSPHAQIALIVASTIGFDFGVQATLVAHQTVVYGLDHGARSRLNALLFTGMFIGMASGAALGSMMLVRFGWPGVVTLATVSSLAALAVRLLGSKSE
ncbi:MAG TPA: MFS transporter, partial [Oxalicibacterium sp.]|nr:MFS transporter [Oxalicibacterium sp.]